MKKTTYILIGMVALIFVAELIIGIYIYSTRIPYAEYRAMHPEWYGDVEVVEASDEGSIEGDSENAERDMRGTTVIDASDGSYRVIIQCDDMFDGGTEIYYTDTLIITSPEKNISVLR